jgi:hypothetical protein
VQIASPRLAALAYSLLRSLPFSSEKLLPLKKTVERVFFFISFRWYISSMVMTSFFFE